MPCKLSVYLAARRRLPPGRRQPLELGERAVGQGEEAPQGVAAEGFSEAVAENERLVRRLEEPALAAEAAITEELRAGR
jgi:hypothetical protein